MTYHLVSNKSNTMVTMYVEGIRLPEHLSSLLVFSWVRVARSLVFYVLLCRSLSFFLLFLLVILLSVLL